MGQQLYLQAAMHYAGWHHLSFDTVQPWLGCAGLSGNRLTVLCCRHHGMRR